MAPDSRLQPGLPGFPAQPVLGPCFSTGNPCRPRSNFLAILAGHASLPKAATRGRRGEESWAEWPTFPDVNVGANTGCAGEGA